MTKHTHTPGPWTIHYDEPQSFSDWSDAGGYRIDADGIEQLAYVWNRSNRLMGNGAPQSAGPKFGAKEAEANARLISAAPELLQALVAWVESTSRANETGSMRPVYDLAVAAIAKARGT